MTFSDAALKEMGLYPLWKTRGSESTINSQPIVFIEKNADSSAHGNLDRHVAMSQLDSQQLKQRIADCTACELHKNRRHAVAGVGDIPAQWMFVGDAPGPEDDDKGEPFVGPAGKLLDNMLASIGLTREKNVFLTNVVKCQPPDNRHPAAEEMASCACYLEQQINLVQPTLIIALGKVAADHLLGHDATIASLRGKIHSVHGVPMIVTYHPDYLLRTMADKAKAWEDLCFARATMAGLLTATATKLV